jgi:adenosine tuberculosinyltransferase
MPSPPPDLPEFLAWPTERVAGWVADRPGPMVAGWPFNGTRRWFIGHKGARREAGGYLSTLVRRQAEFYRMVLDHGVAAILAPSFGELNLRRGEEYARHALGGLLRIGTDEVYRELFRRGVRVRFYGDYRRALAGPEFRPMVEACDKIMAATADGQGPLILFGLFADGPYQNIAGLAVEAFRKTGEVPDRETLIEAYYGVPVPDLSFFVGFEQPQLFDVPLVATGWEDLYFTLNPTPEVGKDQLREILYDHLVTRRVPEAEYEKLPDEAKSRIIDEIRRAGTVGLGRVDPLTGLWRPVLPETGGHPR